MESRIVIEQAKGIIAQRHRITIEQAYQRIRRHARNKNADSLEPPERLGQCSSSWVPLSRLCLSR